MTLYVPKLLKFRELSVKRGLKCVTFNKFETRMLDFFVIFV